MGQSNSNTIMKPHNEPIKYSNESNEWTNYMEWTHYKNLKKDEKYKLISDFCMVEGIFCYYLVMNMVIKKIVMQYLMNQ
jgi:hypothetical protein